MSPQHPVADHCVQFCKKHSAVLRKDNIAAILSARSPLADFDSHTRDGVDHRQDRIDRIREQWNDADPDSSSISTGREYGPRVGDAEDSLKTYEEERQKQRAQLEQFLNDIRDDVTIKAVRVRDEMIRLRLPSCKTFLYDVADGSYSVRFQLFW